MPDYQDSVVSTTTQMALSAGTRRRPISSEAQSRSGSRHTQKEIDLMEQNSRMSQRLVEVLSKQVKTLEAEVARLRESLRECSRCNVLLFCSNRDLSVAAVTNQTSEGVELFSRVNAMFAQKRAALHKRGIGFAVIQDVPLNQVHDTPFSSSR